MTHPLGMVTFPRTEKAAAIASVPVFSGARWLFKNAARTKRPGEVKSPGKPILPPACPNGVSHLPFHATEEVCSCER